MSELVFTVPNHQSDSCGPPPKLDGGDRSRYSYYGYFENCYGEQLVFYREKATGHCFVQMGDCGWTNVLRVLGGCLLGVNVNREEAMAIFAMWQASGHGLPDVDAPLVEEYLTLLRKWLTKAKAKVLYTMTRKEWAMLVAAGEMNNVLLHMHLQIPKAERVAAAAEFDAFMVKIGLPASLRCDPRPKKEA